MEIELQCACGGVVSAPAQYAGHKVLCPRCGRELLVPERPAAVSEAQDVLPIAERSAEAEARGGAVTAPEPAATACPYCMQPIHPQARKCPCCQEYLDPALARARRGGKVSAMAVGSFVVGLISPLLLFVPAVLAVLLGLGGIVATRRGRASGRGLAIAGLLLGLVWTGLLVVLAAVTGRHMLEQIGPAEPLF